MSGFIITTQDGSKYYFTLPLYSYQTISYSVDSKPDSAHKLPIKYGTKNYTKGTFREDLGTHAKTWLLTAITGPDYLKRMDDTTWAREERFLPHDGDIGFWVTFRYEYSNEIDDGEDIYKGIYAWRDPYNSFSKKDGTAGIPATYVTQFGLREITYLKSIETPTEFVYFKTSERKDALGVKYVKGDPGDDAGNEYPKTPNVDWNDFDSLKTFVQNCKKLDEVQWYSKIENPGLKAYQTISSITTQKAVPFKRVKLIYDYILGQESPNSIAKDKTGKRKEGRLTLTDAQIHTRDNAFRPYNFKYSSPDYKFQQDSIDYWGYPNNPQIIDCTSTYNIVDFPKEWYTLKNKCDEIDTKRPMSQEEIEKMNSDKVVWNLSGIMTPKGNLIYVDYERDHINSTVSTLYSMNKNEPYPDETKQM